MVGAVAPVRGPRIGSRGVEDGAAHPVDPRTPSRVSAMLLAATLAGSAGIDVENALPAAAEADHLPAEIVGGKGHRSMQALRPGTSPPPVRIPMRIGRSGRRAGR